MVGKKRKHKKEFLGMTLTGDGVGVSHVRAGGMSFAQFISEVPISTTLLVIGLITLVLAILDFSQAVSY